MFLRIIKMSFFKESVDKFLPDFEVVKSLIRRFEAVNC